MNKKRNLKNTRRNYPAKRTLAPSLSRGSTIVFDSCEEYFNARNGEVDQSYGRSGTDTVHLLEDIVCNLDNADHTFITSSGLSAMIIPLLTYGVSGKHIIVPTTLYYGTKVFIDTILQKIIKTEVTYYTPNEDITPLIRHNTSIIMIESPGSDTFEFQDIGQIAAIAKQHNIVSFADNSWATGLLCKPLDYGIDIVSHSLSKYFNGHSDAIIGSVSCKEDCYQKLYQTHYSLGAIASPDTCLLAIRGYKTMAIRIKQHEESGTKIAHWLNTRDEISKVLHPKIPGFTTSHYWKQYYNGTHGLFYIVMKPTYNKKDLHNLIDSLEYFSIGLSWGGYESIIIPVQLDSDKGEQVARLHIGLEDPDTLMKDLESALNTMSQSRANNG